MVTIAIPCLDTKLIPRDKLVANNYNPNAVSSDKMQLLRQSIVDNGWCFPIVTIYDSESDRFVIIDGFHRWRIAQEDWLDIKMVPVVVLPHSIAQRQIATIQFNKARGVHQVDLDAEVIRSLVMQGMSDSDIAMHLGIDTDTVYRYKQLTGIAELFRGVDYSTSWTMEESDAR